jgi:hypothetical protein
MSKFAKYPIVSLAEFRKRVVAALSHDSSGWTHEQIYEYILDTGIPKFNKDDLSLFMKSIEGRVFMEPVLVDINDSMFYWMVSGTSAMLVKKPLTPIHK